MRLIGGCGWRAGSDGNGWGQAGVSETNLEAIYARYRQALFTLALARTGHRERAEDAVHDAFVRLCRSGLKGAADPLAYVFAAVRNAALDQCRRLRLADRSENEPPLSILDDGAIAPEEHAMEDERRRLIAAAVDALGAEQREALVLRVYADLTFAQIAQVLDTPVQTVCSRYHRALQRLKQHLENLV